MIRQVFIHYLHHFNVLRFFSNRFIIQAASVDAEKFALPANRELLFLATYLACPVRYPPSFLKLFFKNSFSTLSCPIWACNSWVSTSGSSALLPFSKAAPMLASNSALQREIIIGLTSNFLASSARVCWFFKASRATLALKAGANFRRVFFFI